MADDNKRPGDEPFDEGASTEGAPGTDAEAEAEGVSVEDIDEASAEGIEEDELTVQDILDAATREVDEPTSEHLADLKRVTAEYANYRRRTEANREVERERVTVDVVKGLIPVLDDLDRAEKHGDLVEDSAFSTIAAKLRGSVERLGVKSFGTVGEPFDPTIHEAIFQLPTAGIESETVGDVIETGYFLGSSLLRVAKVVVQVPSDG
ncbi:nucleotide exchange factor GrpE [Cryobacterium sp. TMT1-62]|uniref:nucleotide exchange factor GrpE n=1 Tax=unclassified Cryobacterium TaxID=2649013 RepID=UPI000CE4493A|nr:MULTISPECIES: nucleotide exchange factor GrpE [unclassified Cryobacterium]TFB55532.1 nucleotide exchange factor GrpE [Cryobacterium sp. Sr3]TFC34446.1 nucleotide exchange factor GrpE [Cryobacterium sp. TMT2-14]TFC48637.1 nucleotide exchange factor GrpE [Cryobacterium sp. TMT2-17-1]TFD32430.1 nucleotide exchange factor GrpE [Cryobacterium sp. TMT1-62]